MEHNKISKLPIPIITTEEIRFSRTNIESKTVHSWSCTKCGRKLGKFSAQRSWDTHGKIICGGCAQKEDPVYQEWLKEKEMIKCMQWA